MKMKLSVSIAFLALIPAASAAPVKTCSDQKGCISITSELTNASCTADAVCTYKVCIKDDRKDGCVKGSTDSWSHICDGATDGEVMCPRPQDGTNFWDGKEVAGTTGWEMCQYVEGGQTAYFLMKDGGGCNGSGVKDYSSDFPQAESVVCAPTSVEGGTYFGKSCTGNAEEKECAWEVTAPDCPAPVTSPTPAPVTPVTSPTPAPVDTCVEDMPAPGSEHCPSVEMGGVQVMKVIGATPSENDKDIIWGITSVDQYSAKIKINNPYSTPMDVYTSYPEGTYGVKTCSKQELGDCDDSSEEITIKCLHSSPVSLVQVFFVDPTGTSSEVTGPATVDNCCHPEPTPAETAVSHYSFLILCECPSESRRLRGVEGEFSWDSIIAQYADQL